MIRYVSMPRSSPDFRRFDIYRFALDAAAQLFTPPVTVARKRGERACRCFRYASDHARAAQAYDERHVTIRWRRSNTDACMRAGTMMIACDVYAAKECSANRSTMRDIRASENARYTACVTRVGKRGALAYDEEELSRACNMRGMRYARTQERYAQCC